jgi:hypothetical protein
MPAFHAGDSGSNPDISISGGIYVLPIQIMTLLHTKFSAVSL